MVYYKNEGMVVAGKQDNYQRAYGNTLLDENGDIYHEKVQVESDAIRTWDLLNICEEPKIKKKAKKN